MSDGSLNKSSSQGSESVSSTLQVATVLGSSDELISERVVEERAQVDDRMTVLSSFEGGFTSGSSEDDDLDEQEVGEKSVHRSAVQIQSNVPRGVSSSAAAGVVGQQSATATATNTAAGAEAMASSESTEAEEDTDGEEGSESEESQETESLEESDEFSGDEEASASESSPVSNPATVTNSLSSRNTAPEPEGIDTAPLVVEPVVTIPAPQEPDIPPVLSPDYASSLMGGRVLIGEESILANDEDSDSFIQLVSVEGQTVSATGTVSLQGQYGVLNMHHSGQWSYTSGEGIPNGPLLDARTSEVFEYTVVSGGVSATSFLNISLSAPEVAEVLVSSAPEIVEPVTEYSLSSDTDPVLSSFSINASPVHAMTVSGWGWRDPSAWGWSTDNVAASGAVEVNHTRVYGVASDKGYVIELEGYGGDAGNLYKSLPVNAGDHFLMEVDLSARGGVSASSNQVQLLFEGREVETLSPSLGFQTYRYLFMASENQPTLEFKAPVNDGVGVLLDSVRVYSAEYGGAGSGLERLTVSQGQLDIHEARLLGGAIAGKITSENGFSSLDQWGLVHEGGPLSLSINTTDGDSWFSSYRLFSVSSEGQVGVEVGHGGAMLSEAGERVPVFTVNDLPEGHYLLVAGNHGFDQSEAVSALDYPVAGSGDHAYEITLQGAASVERMPKDPSQQASIVDELYSETQASLLVQVDLLLEEGNEEGNEEESPDRLYQYELYSGETELGKGGLLFSDLDESQGSQQVVVTIENADLASLSMDDLTVVVHEVDSSGFVLGQQAFHFDTAVSPSGEPVIDQDGDGVQIVELVELGLDSFDLVFIETGDDMQAVF